MHNFSLKRNMGMYLYDSRNRIIVVHYFLQHRTLQTNLNAILIYEKSIRSVNDLDDVRSVDSSARNTAEKCLSRYERIEESSMPSAIPQINLQYAEQARSVARQFAYGPGTSVGFINCYSLRSSLRLPGRDSTLLHRLHRPN